MDQKLYTFTCNTTVKPGADFPAKDIQANPNTYVQFLPEHKTDSLLMYYIHSILKALIDTQLEFCASNL